VKQISDQSPLRYPASANHQRHGDTASTKRAVREPCLLAKHSLPLYWYGAKSSSRTSPRQESSSIVSSRPCHATQSFPSQVTSSVTSLCRNISRYSTVLHQKPSELLKIVVSGPRVPHPLARTHLTGSYQRHNLQCLPNLRSGFILPHLIRSPYKSRWRRLQPQFKTRRFYYYLPRRLDLAADKPNPRLPHSSPFASPSPTPSPIPIRNTRPRGWPSATTARPLRRAQRRRFSLDLLLLPMIASPSQPDPALSVVL
jgi:hypothetical protein